MALHVLAKRHRSLKQQTAPASVVMTNSFMMFKNWQKSGVP